MKRPILRALAAAGIATVPSPASAADPRATLADLEARLARLGAARVEGTDTVAGRAVPALHFGGHRISNRYAIVDAIRRAHGATATVFVRDGDDFVRVSTNVLTQDGRRGVGTLLARNAAHEAVSAGRSYCGPLDVQGTRFEACYGPIRDAAGAVIGVGYVGHRL